ncbi:MAG: MFS transporter [Alphaproteobacteria bacterium]
MRSEGNWTGILFGLGLAVFAAYTQFKLPPVLPEMLGLFGYDRIVAGGFVAVYAVAGLLLSLQVGGLMQRHGALPYLYGAFGCIGAGTGLALLLPDWQWIMLLARAAEGAGFAVLAVAGPALCTAHAGPRGLALASGLIAMWMPLGALLANGLALGFAVPLGWSSLWWAGLAGTLVMVAWTAALARRGGIVAPGSRHAAAATAPEPMAWQRHAIVVAAFLFMVWNTEVFAWMSWLPAFMVEAHGLSEANAMLAYLLPMATIGIFNLVGARILRTGMPVSLLFSLSLLVQIAGWLLLPVLHGWSLVVLLLVFGAATGISPTCLYAMPGTIFGTQHAGTRAFGILMTGRNLGVLAGPLLLGALVPHPDDWQVAGMVFAAVSALAALGGLYLHRLLSQNNIAADA